MLLMRLCPRAPSAATRSAIPARMSGDSSPLAVQPARADDDGAVRVAHNDPRTHVDELVDPVQALLEHFLVHEDHALADRRDSDHDAHQVGGERGPGAVVDLGDRIIRTRSHHLGGAAARIPKDSTAFSRRQAPYAFNIVTTWSDPRDEQKNIQWVRDTWMALEPYATGGVYVNFLDYSNSIMATSFPCFATRLWYYCHAGIRPTTTAAFCCFPA